MWSSEQTRAHIEAVSGRIAASAPGDLRELLLLVATVHEERDPDRLREAARADGLERSFVSWKGGALLYQT